MATGTATKTDIFIWNGTDKSGHTSTGEIRAASSAIAKAQLRRQGIKPKKIKKKAKPLFGSGGKPIKPADIAVFTRQMATMMKAGVPLVQSFDIVAEGSETDRFAALHAAAFEILLPVSFRCFEIKPGMVVSHL